MWCSLNQSEGKKFYSPGSHREIMKKIGLGLFLAVLAVLSGCSSGTKAISVTLTSPAALTQVLDIGQSFSIAVTVSNDSTAKGATFALTGVGTLSN